MIQVETKSGESGGFELMRGERLDSMLPAGGSVGRAGALMLTDRRVIHLSGGRRPRRASFVSTRGVSEAHLTHEREGYGGLVWAALGFAVAVLLFFTIDHQIGRIAASGASAAMAAYLVVDRLTTPGRRVLTFRAAGPGVRFELPKGLEDSEIQGFINRVYELRSPDRASTFAPR